MQRISITHNSHKNDYKLGYQNYRQVTVVTDVIADNDKQL